MQTLIPLCTDGEQQQPLAQCVYKMAMAAGNRPKGYIAIYKHSTHIPSIYMPSIGRYMSAAAK